MKVAIIVLGLLLLVACQPQALPVLEETAVPPAPTAYEITPLAAAPTVTPQPRPADPAGDPAGMAAGTAPLDDDAPLEEVRPSVNVVNPPPILSLSRYPPRDTPYFVEDGDFWLVHTTDGRLFAFAPLPPAYEGEPGMEPCRYTWVESDGRFVDPCSGDRWEPTGVLDLEHAGARWSNRDLDQYRAGVQEGLIIVQTDRVYPGLPVGPPVLPFVVQHGITMTVAATEFTATATLLEMLVQVDPIWQMDPVAFPPQQALVYPTFPDSLLDDRGNAVDMISRQGGLAIADGRTGGMWSVSQGQWQAVVPDTRFVTVTLTVDLSSLYRQVTLPLDWDGRAPGDEWNLDFSLEIGYAAARVRQVTWAGTTKDGLARLQLTVHDESPAEIRLYCLHLELEDPWQRTCANFNGQKTYPIYVRPGEPVNLHLRASLELRQPFELVVDRRGKEGGD
jgi:hypothetical protein